MVKTSGNPGISEESSLNDWWKKNLMTQVASHDNNLTKTKKTPTKYQPFISYI